MIKEKMSAMGEKNKLFLIFVAVVFLSVFFIGVNNSKAVVTCDANFTPVNGVCFPVDTGLADPQSGIAGILSNILSWLLGIFTTLAIIAFIISGILYLTSTGDEKQLETAKNNAMYALLGVIVGLSGFIILKAIQMALGGGSSMF